MTTHDEFYGYAQPAHGEPGYSQQSEYGNQPDEGFVVMPFYLVCDVSGSMSGDMAKLNDSVQRLRRAILAQPIVNDVARVGIITFSSNAQVMMPLAQISKATIPTLTVGGATNYGSAFTVLRSAIERDIVALKQQGFKVYRPCAFFLTDGAPTDREWARNFEETLTFNRETEQGLKNHPIFVPFGFRSAPETVLSQLAYPPKRAKWFKANTTDIEAALTQILDVIMRTVMTSTQTANSSSPAITIQTPASNSSLNHGESRYDEHFVG